MGSIVVVFKKCNIIFYVVFDLFCTFIYNVSFDPVQEE